MRKGADVSILSELSSSFRVSTWQTSCHATKRVSVASELAMHGLSPTLRLVPHISWEWMMTNEIKQARQML